MFKGILAIPRPAKRSILIAADSVLLIGALWLSFSLRLDNWYWPRGGVNSQEQGRNVLNALYDHMHDMAGIIGFIESEKTDTRDRPASDISGFLFWIKIGILKQTGFMDERFYMYGEETDFFRRVISSGFDIIQSNIVVSHLTEMSATSKIRNSWYAIRNSIFLEVKNQRYLEAVRKIGTLLLVMWWVRGDQSDASTLRVRRPGILIGPVMLLGAVGWNVLHLIWPNRNGEL